MAWQGSRDTKPLTDKDKLQSTTIEITSPTTSVLEKEAKARRSTLKRLWSLIKGELLLLIIGTVCLLGASGANLLLPALTGDLIEIASNASNAANPELSGQRDILRNTIIYMLALFVLQAVTVFIRSYIFTLAGERVVRKLRNMAFRSMTSQGIGFFDAQKTGELLNRLSADTKAMELACTRNVSQFVRSCVMVVGALNFLFVISWKLTLVMLAVVPIVAIAAVLFGNYTKKYSIKVSDYLAAASHVAEEALSNFRTVRSYRQEPKMNSKYSDAINDSYNMAKKLAFVFASMVSFDICLGAIALLAVLWYGVTLVIDQELTVGQLTSFILYTLSIAASFASISSLYFDLMKAVGATDRVFNIIERPSDVVYPDTDQEIDKGEVVLDNVTFAYPTRADVTVLQDFSLKLPAGRKVALVGPSGGGKSTVSNLIQRFYDPLEGCISLDGKPLTSISAATLQKTIAVVEQEPVLFGTTIFENIIFGAAAGESIEQTDVEEAAKNAAAHDFIMDMPDGYQTTVGERGVRLSGGQKQRIAIARALFRNPKILLLDEATSALDAESEHLVQQALEVLMRGRTVLIIAHRLSTVKTADEVVVVCAGKVVESGDHQTLLSKGGMYAQLVQHQLSQS